LYTELEKNRTKNQLKTLFFASYAHELITPINIIKGMNEQAMFLAEGLNPNIVQNLEKSNQTIKKLVFLTEDIIDLSKVEMKELMVNKSDFSIREAIEEVCELYEKQIKLKGLKFEKIIDVGDLDLIYSDKKKLQRIVNNLLGNAVKYTLHGYIML
jgi:signal transduction histidine kinase